MRLEKIPEKMREGTSREKSHHGLMNKICFTVLTKISLNGILKHFNFSEG